MGKKRKPHDPAQLARQEAERAARKDEVQRLVSSGATVKTDAAGRIVSAWRTNVFNLLLTRKSITADHYIAASTFCDQWAAWKGLDGGPDRGEKVDGSSGSKELVTDRMIKAGREIADTLDRLDRTHAKLLCAFAVATVEEDRPMEWRGIVERETTITVRDKQTALVVAMLDELRAVYEGPRRAAA